MALVDLKLNADGDLDLTDYKLSLVTGKDYIQQRLSIALKINRGEWFLDTNFGVPYTQQILGKPPDGAILQSIFISAILAVPGVQSLISFNMNYLTNRQIQVTFTAQTNAGLIEVEEII